VKTNRFNQRGGAGTSILIALVIVLVILVGIGGCAWNLTVGAHDRTLANYQLVEEGKAKMASALETCKTQMAAVWSLADSAGSKEESIKVGFAKARTGFEDAIKAYNEAAKDPSKTPFDLQKFVSQKMGGSFADVKVVMEAVPQEFRAMEGYTRAQNVVSECMNSIRGTIDDWSKDIMTYNSDRGRVVTNFGLGIFWQGKFPVKLEYYTGTIEDATKVKIDLSDIKPKS